MTNAPARLAGALGPLARRPGDLVACYGGEEFAIVLAGTGTAPAEGIAETASAVVALEVPHASAPAGHVPISAGVAMLRASPQMPAAARDLQRSADDALHGTKRAGRNLVRAGPVRIGRAAG